MARERGLMPCSKRRGTHHDAVARKTSVRGFASRCDPTHDGLPAFLQSLVWDARTLRLLPGPPGKQPVLCALLRPLLSTFLQSRSEPIAGSPATQQQLASASGELCLSVTTQVMILSP